jgi:TIR domain
MPLAKDVVGVEDAFINLLQHIPGTKEEKQAYFRSRSIQVPRTNYVAMWEALAGRLHRSGAASAVFELLRTRIPGRVSGLLRTAKQGRPVALYDSDPAIVDDLFFQNGKLRKLGELFLGDLESRGVSMGRSASSKSAAVLKVVSNAKPYEIALSFAGEDRKLVEGVADLLKSYGVAVFYDKFEEVQLWGKDLTAHLAEIYKNRANYCAMFISEHYVSKAWPQLERQHAQSRALIEKREYILPIRLDQSEVPGLPSTLAYVDARHLSPVQIAERLRQKIRS